MCTCWFLLGLNGGSALAVCGAPKIHLYCDRFQAPFINVRLTPGLIFFPPQAGQAQFPLLELDVFYCTCQSVYQGNGKAPIHFQHICLALVSPFYSASAVCLLGLALLRFNISRHEPTGVEL